MDDLPEEPDGVSYSVATALGINATVMENLERTNLSSCHRCKEAIVHGSKRGRPRGSFKLCRVLLQVVIKFGQNQIMLLGGSMYFTIIPIYKLLLNLVKINKC